MSRRNDSQRLHQLWKLMVNTKYIQNINKLMAKKQLPINYR